MTADDADHVFRYADDHYLARQHGHPPRHSMKEVLRRYRLPADPWCIKIRWNHEGKFRLRWEKNNALPMLD